MTSIPKLKKAISDIDRKYKTLYMDVDKAYDDTIYTKENVLKLIQDIVSDIKNIDSICQERNRY